MVDWKLRRAEKQDAPALGSCIDEAYRPRFSWLGRSGSSTEDYTEIIALYHVWVAVNQEQIIGGLVLIPKDDHMLLANIAVRPGYQGIGVGKALLELADAEALNQGYREIRLYTNKAMIENLDMYRRSGWTEMQSDNQDIQKISMKKSLL